MHKVASKLMFDEAVAKLTPRLLKVRDWQINSQDFPLLDITYGASKSDIALRVRFTFDEWDDLPPDHIVAPRPLLL